eukprot:3341175-Rhodomonas_salina.1
MCYPDRSLKFGTPCWSLASTPASGRPVSLLDRVPLSGSRDRAAGPSRAPLSPAGGFPSESRLPQRRTLLEGTSNTGPQRRSQGDGSAQIRRCSFVGGRFAPSSSRRTLVPIATRPEAGRMLSLIHISEPTRPRLI